MGKALIFLAAFSGGFAYADCQTFLMSMPSTRLAKEYRDAFAGKDGALDARALMKLAAETLTTNEIAFKRGKECLKILPGADTLFNRIARRMWTFARATLQFCPQDLIESGDLGSFDPTTRILNLDIDSLVTNHPSQTFAHEYRHLFCDTVSDRADNVCLLDDQVQSTEDTLPGFDKDPEFSYSSSFRLDEIGTFTHDALLEIRALQTSRSIKEIGRLRRSIAEEYDTIQKLQRVAILNLNLALDAVNKRKTPFKLNEYAVRGRRFKRYAVKVIVRKGERGHSSVLVNIPTAYPAQELSDREIKNIVRQRLETQIAFLSDLDVLLDYAEELVSELPEKDFRKVLSTLQEITQKIEDSCNRALVVRES